MLVRQYTQVQITVGPQTWFRVKPCNRPTFYEHGLYAHAAQQWNNLFQPPLVKRRLERVEPISLLELACRETDPQRRVANLSPGHAGRARLQQQWSNLFQFVCCSAKRRNRTAPASCEQLRN